jgi:predicted dehydrogenase
MSSSVSANRRDFLKTAATTTSALLAAGGALNAHAAGDDQIKVGVVGCGGRGGGAAKDVLSSAQGVKIVALADVYKNKAEGLRRDLAGIVSEGRPKELGNKVDVSDDRCFAGLDAFEKLINNPEVNYVILATPPGFRPLHIQAAIAAGKNLFCEKPVGVDGTGIRKVLAAYEEAVKKGLHIVAGTQRRHQLGYLETMKQINDGVAGEIVSVRVYWNGQGIWFRPRRPGMSDAEYQINNWYHFLWTCGDHITEQHVHNLDVGNWVMKTHPIRCDGAGGRAGNHRGRPNGPPEEVGNIFDHFSIDYVYPGDVHMYSSCRHIPGTANNVTEAMVGTKGMVFTADGSWRVNGKSVISRQQDRAAASPYVREHTDLIDCIRSSKPVNELKQVAESTLTAIMGRMSAYTGQPVTWEAALNSKLDTFPQNLTWDSKLPVDPVPIPGKTKLI